MSVRPVGPKLDQAVALSAKKVFRRKGVVPLPTADGPPKPLK
jgi:hypothetical protein